MDTQVNTTKVSSEATLQGHWLRNIHTFDENIKTNQWAVNEETGEFVRPETYDIGAEDSPFRVQSSDVYVRSGRGGTGFDVDEVEQVATTVLLKTPGEKRAQFERNCRDNRKRLREMPSLLGKRLACSQCKTQEGEPECTWHISAVANQQLKAEIMVRAYVNMKTTQQPEEVVAPVLVEAKK
jgi:CubicO group peptidase (beta-lactamase class C family)